MISFLTGQFYSIERDILRRLKVLGLSSVVIASTTFQGGDSTLVLNSDGSWSVGSVTGQYSINDALLGTLIQKFALITDKNFQEKVGVSSLYKWDCNRMRLNEMERLLNENKELLLINLVEKMNTVRSSLGADE